MIQLIVYGLIIATFIGGALAVRNSLIDKGIARQQAIDKPIIEAANNATKEAKAANDSLVAERVRLIADRQACTDQVSRLASDTAEKLATASRAKLAAESKAAALASDAATFKLMAQQQTTGATCNATLATVNDTLRELGARRVRDHGAGAQGGDGGSTSAPANQGAGADTLRIGQ